MSAMTTFTKGQRINGKYGSTMIVLNVTPKQVTVVVFGNTSRKFTFCWDGTGYKRQGQYLTKEGTKTCV